MTSSCRTTFSTGLSTWSWCAAGAGPSSSTPGLAWSSPTFRGRDRRCTDWRPRASIPSTVTDVVLTHLHMDHVGGLLTKGLKERLRPDLRVHVATREAEFWEAPDFSHTDMPAPVPDALRSIATRFLDEYRGQMRTFETEYEVAPGVLVARTGGHTPGHSIVRLASGGDALTFAGDAVFAPGFDNPEWQNGFEHDPEEAARVRIQLLRELAATRESMVATHLPFPSVCHVATAGDVFRCVPATWDY